jgi:hypothetical protein
VLVRWLVVASMILGAVDVAVVGIEQPVSQILNNILQTKRRSLRNTKRQLLRIS